MKKIILASQSPRRKQLLEQAEIAFEIRTAHASEDFPADMAVENIPSFIAEHKARAVQETLTEAEKAQTVIIAADTVVVLDNRVIGKPENEEDAKAILRDLSGRMHRVITGAVILSGNVCEEVRETTNVYFLSLNEQQIAHYVEKYKPMDKAGAYAIQEWIGLIGIEKIDGDFYNVMGLPVHRVLKVLEQMK